MPRIFLNYNGTSWNAYHYGIELHYGITLMQKYILITSHTTLDFAKYLVKSLNISLIRIAVVLSIENTLRSKERLMQHDVKYLSNYHNMVMLSCVHISPFKTELSLTKIICHIIEWVNNRM